MTKGLAGLAGALALAACSAPSDTDVPPVTQGERDAIEDARAMIPASDLPPDVSTAPPTESPAQ